MLLELMDSLRHPEGSAEHLPSLGCLNSNLFASEVFANCRQLGGAKLRDSSWTATVRYAAHC